MRRIAVAKARSLCLGMMLGLAAAQFAVAQTTAPMKITVGGQTRAFLPPDAPAMIIPTINLSTSFGPEGGFTSWTITDMSTKGVVASGTQTTPTLMATRAGVYALRVDARRPTGALIASAAASLVVTAPIKPTVAVTGPKRIGLGWSGRFYANVKLPFNIASTNLQLLPGEWLLPDGTTMPAAIDSTGRPYLQYYPPTAIQLGTNGLGAPFKVTYSTAFAGFESSTTASASATSQAWRYTFPSGWAVTAQVVGASKSTDGTPNAPAMLRATVKASDPTLVPYLDGLRYEWMVSPSVMVTGEPTSVLNGRIVNEGTTPISVRISDNHGFVGEAQTSVTVGPPPPLTMTVNTARQSKWKHAPLQLGVTAKVAGGVGVLDPVTSYSFKVDGVVVAEQAKNTTTVTLPAGVHTVLVTAQTQRGMMAEMATSITVPEPDVPTCSMSAVGTPTPGSVVSLTANATSTTGYIAKYYWTSNASTSVLSNSTNKMSFKVPTSGASYTAHAVSDAGLECSVSWPQ